MTKGKRILSPRQPCMKQSTSQHQQQQFLRKLDDGCPPVASVNPPKHVPLPEIPKLREFTIEAFLLFFSIGAVGLQCLNLYRTAFWLPHSNTKYAMHFHLIDSSLVSFIVVLMARRLAWIICRFALVKILHPSHWSLGLMVGRVMFIIILSILLGNFFFSLTTQLNLIRVIALFYPFIFYLLKFKLETSSFLEIIPSLDHTDEKSKQSKMGKKAGSKVLAVHHTCSNSVEAIRAEVDLLREDCNKRIAQVIFQTVVTVHYATLVPCVFASNTLFYDHVWVKIHTGFVAITTLVWHLIYCFPARYCDILHRSAMHLGGWTRLDGRANQAPFNNWSSSFLWPQGAHVRLAKDFYRAEGYTNAAEPNNSSHCRFFMLFHDPWRLQLALLVFHSSFCLAQFAFLVTLHQWQQVLASAFVLAACLAALFILLRDFIILQRVYKFERTYQSKSN